MSRIDIIVRAVVAGLGIVALAVVATSIAEDRSAPTAGGGGGAGIPTFQGEPPETNLIDVPEWVQLVLFAIAVIAVLALLWYVLTDPLDALRTALFVAAAGIAVITVLVVLWWLLSQLQAEFFGAGGQREHGLGAAEGPAGFGEPGGTSDQLPAPTVTTIVVVGSIVLIAAVAILRRVARGRVASVAVSSWSDDESRGVGDVAGRAADRMEDAEPTTIENEIYRAWLEMTRLLEVDRPETSTPGEFAAAAIAADLDEANVAELTQLFEDVRYGTTETTGSLEERAITVFRRIEAAHASSSDDGSSTQRGGQA